MYIYPRNYGIGWISFCAILQYYAEGGRCQRGLPRRSCTECKRLWDLCVNIFIWLWDVILSTNGLGRAYEIISILATWRRMSENNQWCIQTEWNNLNKWIKCQRLEGYPWRRRNFLCIFKVRQLTVKGKKQYSLFKESLVPWESKKSKLNLLDGRKAVLGETQKLT